jgi:hypothetical protein
MRWPARLRIPRPDVDLQDIHVYGGLALAAAGGWALSPAITAIVLGVLLALLGVWAPRWKR